MITKPSPSAIKLLKIANKALLSGNKAEARYWAMQAVAVLPNREEPWIILAALASPKASVEYLKHALEINPESKMAIKGMLWAVRRNPKTEKIEPKIAYAPEKTEIDIPSISKPRRNLLSLVAGPLLIIALISVIGFSVPNLIPTPLNAQGNQDFSVVSVKETHTATATSTFTPTITPTSTPTNTPTPLPTATFTPTATYPPPTPVPVVESYVPSFSQNGAWIDVDLSQQRVTAYQGNTIVNSFIASTGTWQYPTVTGSYQIYIKYDSQTMSGPGYNLPGVPHVMYFYSGYAIHGTYWHSNFGTPMSHGCVNLSQSDAAWIYNFASVGTWVNVHY